jgi:hypothetical protein
VRSRIPLVLAGFLIIALIATVGLAAFSPGEAEPSTEPATVEELDMALPISGRVASAVLALAVAPVRDADLATSTTVAVADPAPDAGAGTDTSTVAPETTTTPESVAEQEDESVQAAESSVAVTEATAPASTTTTRKSDTTPPALQVLSPKNGATVTKRVIEFTGVTERGAEVFSGPFEAETDGSGNWAINLVLAPGDNGAAFTARDAAGNETTVRIVITYDAPTTTTTTKAPATTTTADSSTATTKPPATTTTKATTTTTAAPTSKYSPQWPADSGGIRNVESWRSTVAKYWRADQVDCVLGIIKRESRGDPTAYNSSFGASGLMQHLAKYWPSRAAGAGFVDSSGRVASPFNGAANIAAGKWLADYYEGRGSNWWVPWSRLPSYGSCGS